MSGPPTLQPVPGTGADVMPLEALRVPAALDGSARLNRAPVPAYQTELATDLQAVPVWNAIRGAYRRETERLLPWAIAAKGKRLPSLNTPHCAEYLAQFLRDPQPAERWIGRGRVERFDPAWQPFVEPLSECSRDTARRILDAVSAWLIGPQYLLVNPFGGLLTAQLDTTGRTLTRTQWQYVLQIVLRPQSAFDVSGERVATQRDAFVLLFVYATGLRSTELAAATTGGLTRPALDDAWSLLVTATGRRACTVPMPRRLIDELRAQLRTRLVPLMLGTAPADTLLIAHLMTCEALRLDVVGCSRGSLRGPPVSWPARIRTLPRTCTARARTGCANHCEPRAGRRRRHTRHAGSARSCEPGHHRALHEGGCGAAVPGGRGVFQFGARRF